MEAHRTLLSELDHRRRAKRWSLRHWAVLVGKRPNTVSDVMAGNVWPEVATVMELADALGLRLELRLVEPLPRRDLRYYPVRGPAGRVERRRFAATVPSNLWQRVALYELLLLRQLEYVRRARGISSTELCALAGLAPNTVTRVAKGPGRGQVVSYKSLLSACFALGAGLHFCNRLNAPVVVWEFAPSDRPSASDSFPVWVRNVNDA